MEYQKLMLEKQDRVCLVKINYPEALNALNTVILQELDRAFDEIAADPETDVVILTGEGRSFVAGADIAEMSVMKAEEGRRFGELGAAVFRKTAAPNSPKRRPSSAFITLISAISAPATNERPSPVRITTSVSGSAAISSNARSNSCKITVFKAFNASG